jgi:integrase
MRCGVIVGKLTNRFVETTKNPGRYSDGNGLILNVLATGGRNWLLRVQYKGKRRDFGLGGYPDNSLAKAREKAGEYRRVIKEGEDPLANRATAPLLFKDAAEAMLDKGVYKNPKTGPRYRAMLVAYAYPSLGKLHITSLDVENVSAALAPIWKGKADTAQRVLELICRTISSATADGYRVVKDLSSAIRQRLGKQPKGGHMHMMPYIEVSSFMERLSEGTTISRLALRFCILTAARSSEVRQAAWEEIDWVNRLWNIPAGRMKVGTAHSVPLSEPALAVLKAAKTLQTDTVIFPSPVANRRGKGLSDNAMRKLLQDMGLAFDTHGFRASFKTWAQELAPTYSDEVSEACLAHAVSNKLKAAYGRAKFDVARRELLDLWGDYLRGGSLWNHYHFKQNK